ncbi:hypothetical protein PVIIG_05851 [Plasmodium vivax India VII]|uniref:Variable surface protein Vir35 n=1 Tax=Plasmodium vivax India VII TaxID=1077284 RepID=A0A0J9S222_PLAVI|nr:hypothetical protein PVIIG_05851 [Plasmodium vivax India VII]
MNYLKGNTWKVRNHRLLTNDDPQSEIEQSSVQENLKEPGAKNKIKDITGSSDIYEKVKKDTSNSMHAYIKKLEHGYTNKKGLKRLDCLYEKKLFDEMYRLDKIAGSMKSENSYLKKVIWKRYGLRFIVFLLVILFGIVGSIVCKFCGTTEGANCGGSNNISERCKNIENVLLGTNGIIFIPLIIAYLSFILYILSKVEKYRRLKKKYSKTRKM